MTKFLLIDTMNTLFRAKSVTQGDPYDKSGLALMIAMNSIKWAWQKFNADHAVFALEGRSWRKDYYPQYKANRAVSRLNMSSKDIDEDQIFLEAANDFMNFIKTYTKCTVLQHNKCEADDFIARFIQLHEKHPENEFIIISSDSDYMQLLSPQVKIYDGVQKKLYTNEGVLDEKMKPWLDKKGNIPNINPEYMLFEKCIRGDKSDNIMSAYPGVRTKSSKAKVGIDEAFADRANQGFAWMNFMKSRWTDIDGVEHIVENDYKLNKMLIDLTLQPDDIKILLDEVIFNTLKENKDERSQIGVHFLKFCGRNSLKRLSEQPEAMVQIFNKGFSF